MSRPGGLRHPTRDSCEGAFASLSLEPDGPRLIVYDQDDINWNRQDRLDFVAGLVPMLPHRRSNSVSFHQDPTTNRIFFARFSAEDSRYYLFEAGLVPDLERILCPPRLREGAREPIYLSTT